MIVTSLPAVDSQTSPTFEKLVLALRPKLHGYSRRFFKNLSDREDLVQETLFKAFRCRAQFHEGLLLSAWLYTIMRNEFIDKHARRRDVPISDIVGLDDVLVSLPAQHWVAFGRVVAKRIDCLPNNQRTALLAICRGASYQDAATEMGCELATVRTWISRARNTLSSEMGGIFDLPRFQ